MPPTPLKARVSPMQAQVGCDSNAILLMHGQPNSVQHICPSAGLQCQQDYSPEDRQIKEQNIDQGHGGAYFWGSYLLSMCLYLSHSTSLCLFFSCWVGLHLLPGLQLWSPFYMCRAWLRPLGTTVLLLLIDGSHK